MKAFEKDQIPAVYAKKDSELVGEKSKISPKAPALPPFELRKDRVGTYLQRYLKHFVFDEFSAAYIERLGKADFLKGAMIPLRKEDYEGFSGGEGLKPEHIAENMICVMGADPKFKYVPQYIEFMNRCFGPKILEGILKRGRHLAEKEQFEEAALYFRGILMLKADYKDAMYSYARVCRELYLTSEDPEYVGRFKAESIEYFELLIQLYPRYAEAYYFLGYGYLNLGLYLKSDLVWQEYLKLSMNPKDKKEIRERREQLKEPIEIEGGINCSLSGRFEEAIQILEPYTDPESRFKEWWPLSYYLGVSYARTGKSKPAFVHLLKALNKNPSHIETMLELADLYALANDKENEKKYRKKAELIFEQLKKQEAAN